MKTNLLQEAAYLGTFADPMKPAGLGAEPPFEFWDYFEAIPTDDFEGHDCSAGTVSKVYSNANNTFMHVLVDSEDTNIFMVIILDLQGRTVYGHRLLDLNREYGLNLGEPSC